jgi:hypothetical protein
MLAVDRIIATEAVLIPQHIVAAQRTMATRLRSAIWLVARAARLIHLIRATVVAVVIVVVGPRLLLLLLLLLVVVIVVVTIAVGTIHWRLVCPVRIRAFIHHPIVIVSNLSA